MIELKNASKYYNPGLITQTCIFNNFNLKINSHEFVSIIGSNGSGKTTLLNIICGSIPLDSGDIYLNNEKITQMPEYKRMKRIGRVYQNPALGTCSSLNIIENLSLAENKNKPFGLDLLVKKDRIDYYKEKLKYLNLGLEDKCDIPMGSLSGGQRQAVALLMSTMIDIDFLILDEHTAALDPKTADVIMELTNKIVIDKKITALMVTHNLKYAVSYGNRLIMMHEGKNLLDLDENKKKNVDVDDLLNKFNDISIEYGN